MEWSCRIPETGILGMVLEIIPKRRLSTAQAKRLVIDQSNRVQYEQDSEMRMDFAWDWDWDCGVAHTLGLR